MIEILTVIILVILFRFDWRPLGAASGASASGNGGETTLDHSTGNGE